MYVKKQNRGSIILPTLLVIMIIATLGFTYLQTSLNEFKMAYRTKDMLSALNLAEGGIEEAMLAMKNKKWGDYGWTTVATDHYYKMFNHVTLYNGQVGTIRVYASVLDEDAPIIFAEGEVASPYGSVKKQIRCDLGKKGIFLNGMTAKEAVVFNGTTVTVDSYNSDNGAYHLTSNRRAEGTIGSLSTAQGELDSGNADIFGYIATGGGDPTIGPGGIVSGDLNATAGTVDSSRIAKDFVADFPDVSAPDSTTLGTPITTLPTSGQIGIAGGVTTYYKVPSWSTQSSETLEIIGPVVIVVEGDIATKGEIKIVNDVSNTGSLELYAAGDVTIAGNGIMNMSDVPANFMFFGTASSGTSQNVKIAGNGAIKAAIYTPNADLELKGSGSSGVFMGAAVANNIKMTGNFEFHYDEALDNITLDNSYRLSRWRELIESDERVPLDIPSDMVAHAQSF